MAQTQARVGLDVANARHRHATGLTALLHRGTAGGRGGENEFVIVAAQGAEAALHLLRSEVEANSNDARWLRERQREEQLLGEVSRLAAQRFRTR